MNIFEKRELKKKLERYETSLRNLTELRDRIIKEEGGEPLGTEISEFDYIGTYDWSVSRTKDNIFKIKNELGIYEI